MFKPKTYLDICFAMKLGSTVDINGTIGTIKKIALEDGSGHRFIVTMATPNDRHCPNLPVDVYFRE